MKHLYIVVEGQTEEKFVTEILSPYFNAFGFYNTTPVKIQTSRGNKGGFVNYQHLKNDVTRLLKQPNAVVTTLVDFFRIPKDLPNYQACMEKTQANTKIECLEQAMQTDIGSSDRFFPYIQKYEFEALLFSSKQVFVENYEEKIANDIAKIIDKYLTPEEINDNPTTAPSKRLLSIIPDYNKVIDGNLIALEVGITQILKQCPRFKEWIELLKSKLITV